MTKKEKFEVSVAAFEALLSKNKLWLKYLVNFCNCTLKGRSEEVYTDWKKWASLTPQDQWCAGAFGWNTTQQGRKIWKDLDYQWLIWICKNLKK